MKAAYRKHFATLSTAYPQPIHSNPQPTHFFLLNLNAFTNGSIVSKGFQQNMMVGKK
jgi:hypothetical protein